MGECRFTQVHCFPFRLQPIEETSSLIDVSEEFVNSKACLKADPSQFELLKVLGQGSFGKVICSDLKWAPAAFTLPVQGEMTSRIC